MYTTLPSDDPHRPPASTGPQEPRKMKMQPTAGRVDQLLTKGEWSIQLHCIVRPDTSCCKDLSALEYWLSLLNSVNLIKEENSPIAHTHILVQEGGWNNLKKLLFYMFYQKTPLMSTKYTKRSMFARFGRFCFLTFSDLGKTFLEKTRI